MRFTAEALDAYLHAREPIELIAELERGSPEDPIGQALAAGLERALKENEPRCFTLERTWRFATRQQAARSRIGFLSEHVEPGATIVDASCGIGLMLRELAHLRPERLIGFELDPVAAALARANAKLFGIDAEIHVLDSTSPEAESVIRSADLVFCDPERTAGAQTRNLDESTPAYAWLAERAQRLAYEVSPRIPVDTLPGIVELYSERRRHARTTIYSGFEASATRRVVSDRGEMLSGDPHLFTSASVGEGEELELLDPTVAAAGLAYLLGDWHEAEGRYLRITNIDENRPFVEPFVIIARGSKQVLRDAAIDLNDFGRIVVRYPVEEREYWTEANSFRKSGSGDRTLHVFRVNGDYVLAEQVP